MRPALRQLEGKKELVGAEVGVEHGENALDILCGLDIAKLYLVDSYLPYVQNWEERKPKGKLTKALKSLQPFKDKVVWLITTSLEATKFIEDNSLDFVYIDCNHQYEFVKADIKAWLPKVKKGGIFGGHDYDEPTVPGVKKAVDEMFGKIERGQAYDWWIVK